jgi:hypothetical protein
MTAPCASRSRPGSHKRAALHPGFVITFEQVIPISKKSLTQKSTFTMNIARLVPMIRKGKRVRAQR